MTTTTTERGGALGVLDDIGGFLTAGANTFAGFFDAARGVVNEAVGFVESAVKFDPARGTVTVGAPAGVAKRSELVKKGEASAAGDGDLTLVIVLLGVAALALVLLNR